MNQSWKYVPFRELFVWKGKSKIKSGDGSQTGKYKMFVCSDSETKRYDECLECAESIVFGTGGKASCHYVNEPFAYSTDCIVAQAKTSEMHMKFYYYFFRQKNLAEIQKTFTGSGLQHTSKKKIESLQIPVCDLKEQQLIVTKIEELFSKLDKGVEELNKIKELLKIYRQAVLKEAFEGNLTETWRKTNIIDIRDDFEKIRKKEYAIENTFKILVESLPTGWIAVHIGEIFDVEVGATPRRNIDEYWNGEICWVSSGEVRFNSIINTKEKLTQAGVENSSTNIHPIGTVLLAMIGEGKTRGQAAILNVPAAHNQNTAAILVSKTPCSSKYIYYYFLYTYENTRRVGSGNNQKALNKDRVKSLVIPFTSFDEQNEIVKEIEARLSVCDKIEQTVNESLQKAESLRQSILKQAFEGKLV